MKKSWAYVSMLVGFIHKTSQVATLSKNLGTIIYMFKYSSTNLCKWL